MKKRKLTKMSAVLLATALSAATVFSGCNKKVDYDMGDGTQKEGSAGEGGELSSRLGVPESYEGKLDVGDSGIKEITIKDDDIITPDSDSMFIRRIPLIMHTGRRSVRQSLISQRVSMYMTLSTRPRVICRLRLIHIRRC